MRISDWSSDVCSSDLVRHEREQALTLAHAHDAVLRTREHDDPVTRSDDLRPHPVTELQLLAVVVPEQSAAEDHGRREIAVRSGDLDGRILDRKSTRLNSSH